MRWLTTLIPILLMTVLISTPFSVLATGTATVSTTRPFASAANPCGETTQEARQEIDTYLGLAVEHFKSKPYAEVFAPDKQGGWESLHPPTSERSIMMTYTAIPPAAPDEVPVILVNFGTANNTLNMNGILWLEKGEWHAQPYPQAVLPDIAKQRRTVLMGYFCKGVLLKARQQGEFLAVINDLGAGGTRIAQEVHLLKRAKAGHWIIIWVPQYKDWRDVYMSQITFGNNSIHNFTVKRMDNLHPNKKWQETWQLQGYEYKRVSRQDLPPTDRE